ncbi:hypothetical protein BST95_08260 [Halioglobus japonicus]|uniref:XRE family transcriptional regulator n=1 Tax=Halioglobus japonicus TaxID=930805 RepID=A0AAP8MEC0_9GAMM|nr:helix-turn-helix transcriptional regulator [Halioglobus japonicus]AQA18226.1 hypothetical protein BST95_08260 [Halioglobus japonicus]PLW86233.1 XRE family transcriptional regulator [Halioglobus japonicus]GHD13792.1 XRE family transcriptional regulator [Halioglobus japonicus]
MIVRKLRLQRGWSQDQLAEFTGLSVRTIQRIERGQRPSLESSKALASVFEVDISTFIPEDTTMEKTVETPPERAEIKDDERAALTYAKNVKDFYQGIFVLVVLGIVFVAKLGPEPKLLLFFGGMTLLMGVQALFTFEIIRLPFQNMEKRIAEKKLGRKL